MVVATKSTEERDAEFASWSAPQAGAAVGLVDQPASEAKSAGPRLWTKVRARARRTSAAPDVPPPPSKPASVAPFGQKTTPVAAAPRSDSGRRLEAHFLTLLAAALALPALRAPAAWLIGCATAAIVLVAADTATGRATTTGAADVVVVPARAVGRVLRGWVNPLNWLKVVLGALGSLAAGALAGAALATVRWLVIEGPDGLLAAARMGAWAHAPTYGAAFACYLLLRGVQRTHQRRAAALYRRTRRLPEAALVATTVLVVAASLAIALAGPRLNVGFVRSSNGLGWVPPGLRTAADGLRDDIVKAELDGVTHCLSGHHSGLWTYEYTAGNPLNDPDVATLTADPARAPDQQALAAAALAAHNHLAPWVQRLTVTIGNQVILTIDRRGLISDRPLTDATQLRAHATGAPQWLSTVAPTVNRSTVLTCSARTPL